MPDRSRFDRSALQLGALGGLSGSNTAIPKGTADIVMDRLFPKKRSDIDTSEERRQAVYDYLDIYGALPDHYKDNPGEFDIRIKWNGYIPHAPQEKQHAFLWTPPEAIAETPISEGLYGGQAGGGKSDALIMAAAQYADIPGYAALIIRQSFPDLNQPGAIMTRAKEWFSHQPGVKWNENTRTLTFPGGAKVVFGFLKRDDDVYQYQSSEYQFIGFDELTQFTEFQYTYMRSRLRRLEGMPVPLRLRGATNPGGKGHQWVRRYWIDQVGHKEPGRFFIPASLNDNRFLDREAYRISLEGLDPYTRAQYLHGDWTARPPGNWAFDHAHLDAVFRIGDLWFKQWRDDPEFPPPVGGFIHAGLDFGEASHVVAGYPLDQGSMWVPVEMTYAHGEPDREARRWMTKIEPLKYPLGRSRFDSSKPESMRLFYRTLKEERGPEFGRPSPVAFNKHKRAAVLHFRGMASRAAWGETRGILGISSAYCPILESQLYELKFKGEDTEDLVKEDDHGPDATFALLAPEVKRWVSPSDNPPGKSDGQATQEDAEEELRRSVLASG